MKQKSPMLWIAKHIRRRIPALALLGLSNIANAVLGVYFALGTRDVIDYATGADREAFIRACIIQGCIILGILLTLTLNRHLRDWLLANLDRDWKKTLLSRLLHADFSAASVYHSGELMNRLNNDVRAVDDGLVGALPNVISMLAKLIAAVGTLLLMEPGFTVVLFGAGILVVIFTGFIRRSFKTLQKRVSEEEGKVSSLLQESLEKLLMIQSLDVSDEIEARADAALEKRYSAHRRRKNASLAANTSISILYYLAGFAALLWCSSGLINGTMTFGTLTAMTQLVNQLQSPFVGLSGIMPRYVAMIASAERLMELDDLKSQPDTTSVDCGKLYDAMQAIGAEDLTFSYDRDLVLKDASFSIPRGCFAVITGPSGTGKSTLLKLMLCIFRPEKGTVYLQSENGRLPLLRSMRRLFAYVPQGNLLLSGTLRDNLTITRPDATEDEIREAVYVSAMDAYLPQLPQGLDTILGEGGAGLSEGQSQRLAIARAILSGAPIILLDEGTSALDADTEALVLRRIRELPGRTCIAVTHRPAAVELSDWIVEIHNGKIGVRPSGKNL